MSVVDELLTLPSWVTFEGVTFEFRLFQNREKELRFAYMISYVSPDSPHKAEWERDGTWLNKLQSPSDPCSESWLYLQEGIDCDNTLIWAIRQCWYWLQEHGLLAGLGGSLYG